MIIRNNLSAIHANRVLKFNEWETDKTMAKLASGERITKSADDASGLAVSEKMRTQIMGLRQAERNTEDGMSFVQASDGYLGQLTEVLQRVRVLAVQSANGIYTAEDRQMMQTEVSQLVDEVDRISSQAEFNHFKIFLGDFARSSKTGSMWFHMGANMHQRERVHISTMTATSLQLKESNAAESLSSAAQANDLIGIVDGALGKVLKQRADLGSYSNRLELAARGLMSAYENIQASESRIRDADMAEEMVRYTSSQILQQSGTAMLSHATQKTASVMRLLGRD